MKHLKTFDELNENGIVMNDPQTMNCPACNGVLDMEYYQTATVPRECVGCGENIEEVLKTNPKNVCGVKIFMGSSTGNMLVDEPDILENLFSRCELLIATHCEDEETIKEKME